MHIKGIVSLQLGGGFGDEALSHISEMKRLEQLDLSKACVTKAGMKHLSKLSNLEGLQLPNIALGPDELAHLSELKQLRELPPVAKLDDETLMHVGNLTGLERLPWPIYGHDGATDAGISHLRSLSKLRSLMFQGSQVTNNGLQVLQELPDLTYIRLWECPNISDEGLEHVGSLKELKRLELTRTKGIRDEGLKHLQPLQKLTHLYLTSTSITDRGMLHLHSLASLEYLAIEDTKVTPEAVESIKQSLPNCRVSSGPASILGRAPMLLP